MFSPEMHPNHTLKQHLLHLSLAAASLPGSCTDIAPAAGQGREKRLQTSLRKGVIIIINTARYPPDTGALLLAPTAPQVAVAG